MKKCPIKPKTSDLASAAGQKAQRGGGKYMSPARLAQLLDCSQRTAREYCKSGLIPEAFTTHGGHWRIRMPLSVNTRYELEKRQPDWPFKGKIGGLEGDWAPDLAEWLMLALVYQADIRDPIPVPYLAELPDFPHHEESTDDPKESAARKIQDEIIQRLKTGKPFNDFLLIGWVYQYSRQGKDRPTVADIADFMGISRGFYYRQYTSQQLHKAYQIATGEFKRDLPDPRGLESVQRANRNAKKPTFASLQRDLY
jgi:Helix-turn-helix domain